MRSFDVCSTFAAAAATYLVPVPTEWCVRSSLLARDAL